MGTRVRGGRRGGLKVHASARLVATAGAAGRTTLSRVRGEAPVLPRRTGTCADGAALVYLVGGAAGPLGGDRLALDLEVGPGAGVEVRSVAATVVLPGTGRSSFTVTARVAAGGWLRWRPEPLVAARGCDHVGLSTVDLAAGGNLLWRDILVCGRHGEEPGDVRLGLSVHYDGRPLLVHELAVGPSAAGWAGAAVLGGARSVGSTLIAGPTVPPGGAGPGVLGPTERVCGATAAMLPLAGPGRLACAVGADAVEVARHLDALEPDAPPGRDS